MQIFKIVHLRIDANGIGEGAVEKKAGFTAHPVSYPSSKLDRIQLNYLAFEKEMLSFDLALQHYEAYVGSGGQPPEAFIDRKVLAFLSSIRKHNAILLPCNAFSPSNSIFV